jgi:hypothetical protein
MRMCVLQGTGRTKVMLLTACCAGTSVFVLAAQATLVFTWMPVLPGSHTVCSSAPFPLHS